MPDVAVDSSVVAKWFIPEDDSPLALKLLDDIQRDGKPVLLDLAFVEVSNAIWKRFHRGMISADEARKMSELLGGVPTEIEPAMPLLARALTIAMTYQRSVDDALFVALDSELGLVGVTADEPLHRAVEGEFPNIRLLRDC